MKWLFLLLIATLGAQETAAQDISLRGAGELVSADGVWKWHEGDNLAWASPDFDDSGWGTISVPKSALPRQSGALWLRVRVTAEKGAHLAIGTAPLAEAVEIYWNGQRIGGLGRFSNEGKPVWDVFPRSVVATAPPMTTGRAVIAIRLNRPPGHAHYPIILGESSLFAGTEDAVRARIALRFTFPAITYTEIMGIPFDGWITVLWWAASLLLGIYLLIAWYSAPEIYGFLWLGLNILPNGLVAVLFTYEATHTIDLGLAERLLAVNNFVSFEALAALYIHLSGLGRRWLWIVLVVPGLGELLWDLASPGQSLPMEYYFLEVALATVTLGAWIFVRRNHLPNGLLMAIATAPYAIVTFFESITLAGIWQDFPLLRLEQEHDGAAQISCNLLMAIVLGLYFQKTLEAMRREKTRLGQELAAGREMQTLLLERKEEPEGNAWEVGSVYEPANEVGGDFYWTRTEPDGSLVLVVGDVSGKGLKAAMLVSAAIGTLRRETSSSPAEVLDGLNRSMVGYAGGGFVTCCCARFDAEGTVTIANAGHPAPYCDGKELETEPGLPLGIAPRVEYAESTVRGKRFTFVSDGVVEAENAKRELFGFERTREVSGKSAQEIAETARAWGQNDDITVLTVWRQA